MAEKVERRKEQLEKINLTGGAIRFFFCLFSRLRSGNFVYYAENGKNY